MIGRTIPQGQYVAPIHAAESYVGRRYTTTGADDGEYGANPADYWYAADADSVGSILGPLTMPATLLTGEVVGYTTLRVLKSEGTVGDLRRLARAAAGLVRP